LDIFGRVKEFAGEVGFVPFRYQGQYVDVETGLCYNRFRYYDPESGQYTQQDPIGLAGSNPTLYGYVANTLTDVDQLGLLGFKVSANTALPDVLTRGLHVNVEIPNNKPIHVGLRPDHQGGFKFVPSDPKASQIFKSDPSMWKKITNSINDFIAKPSNASKLADTASAAKTLFPHRGAEFAHAERNLRRGMVDICGRR